MGSDGAILAIDQGTTGTRCIVFDRRMRALASAYREHRQHFPQPGWVEHDPQEIWEAAHAVAGEALRVAAVEPGALAAVGITNQRETVCVWDRSTGEPLHRAIVWQDRRTAERCERLRAAGHERLVRERTGLVLDPYFSATKLEWLLEHVPALRERAAQGDAAFGTIDSWLVFKLTGEHVTDLSNASRTLLCDIARGRWDQELLDLFGGIPERALPQICPSAGALATTRPEALHGHAATVAGIAGDQQAALFGQACTVEGMGKNTYGTGSFVLLNAGRVAPAPVPGLLGSVAWDLGEGPVYALEASIFVTGAAVQWLRDGIGVIGEAGETEALARSLEDNDGVYFVPALTGLGSPHWDPDARGTIVGLTRGSTRAHLARAALEAMAYQTLDAVKAMEGAAPHALSELRVDGGASANDWLMQFQADILGVPVLRPAVLESTALGAAQLAAVGSSLMSAEEVGGGWHAAARFEPRMSAERRDSLVGGWRRALGAARNLAREAT